MLQQDDKFFARLLSKENHSKAESSFRVLYYGKSSGSVPFTWETKPGTPKHPLSLSSLPPLTPPPSFQLNHTTTPKKTTSKPNFLFTIFKRKPSKKCHVSPSYSSASISSSSRSSSSFSSSSMPMNPFSHHTPMNPFSHRRGWLFCSRSSTARFRMKGDDNVAAAGGSPTPSSGLGGGHGLFRQFSNRRSKVNVKCPL